ncbi:HK97 family phage prohead protease [Paenibacillus xylanilyticus]|uniref:HK97 family phage prohead protease n=1 Tax=Paenibacillus xylanilyticus TaxID=248903 RepID=A0A7Y6BRM6_9BACL|nr:HK97 family phage prohead protease [Paenibacillus xylanilyticus]NUU73754.1 HK97 family phage prohead protease [Paenibacillus xylanilyticus]
MEKTMPKLTKETRALPVALEIRADEENGQRTITGAIKYDTDSNEMRDWYGDTFVEQIASGAFAESIKTRGVVGLWSHDTSQVLGNTKSGTLRLVEGTSDLRFELDIPDTTVGNDAWALIQRGDVDGVSFGMKVTKDKWSSEKRDDGTKVYKRSILNAELFEISPVAFPAYPSNEVTARSLEDFKAEEARAGLSAEKEKILMELDLI